MATAKDEKAKATEAKDVETKGETKVETPEVSEEVKSVADEALADYTNTDSLNTRGDVVVSDEGDVTPVAGYPVPKAARPGYVPARDALLDESGRDDIGDNKRAYK